MIVDSTANDIVYSNLFTGVHGNYLRGSIERAGLDPNALPESDPSKMNFGSTSVKAWKDIWGAGQGVGAIKRVVPAGELVRRFAEEYALARRRLGLGEARQAARVPSIWPDAASHRAWQAVAAARAGRGYSSGSSSSPQATQSCSKRMPRCSNA